MSSTLLIQNKISEQLYDFINVLINQKTLKDWSNVKFKLRAHCWLDKKIDYSKLQ